MKINQPGSIALRLSSEAIDWEDAEWDTDDASSGDGFHSGSDDDSEMGYACAQN